MFRLIKLIILIGLLAMSSLKGYAQNLPRICICFQEETKFINVKIKKDSTYTDFRIVREGFETPKKREIAQKEWQHSPTEAQFPYFYYDFYAVSKPQKIDSVKNIQDCVDLVTVEEYRQTNFQPPDEARSNLVIFIKKRQDSTFLKWEAVEEPIE